MPPESSTNLVTGGREGFRGARWPRAVDDFRVRFEWPCLAWTKKASDTKAMLSNKRRLSTRAIVLNYVVRLKFGGAGVRVLVVFDRPSSMQRMAGMLSDDLPKHRSNGGRIKGH